MNLVTIFDILWLLSILVLLFLIWRSSERRLKHVSTLETTLVGVSQKNAESVQQSVQATQEVIAMLKADKNRP